MTAVTIDRGTASGFRLALAAAITSTPAYGAPPDDVAHIPCAVVGPPAMTKVPAQGGLWDLRYEIVVVGRRYDFTEVHTELDDVAWAVIGDLEAAATTIPGLRIEGAVPGFTSIGGHTQPNHTITVAVSAAYCL